ncbi:hypothetical protein EEL34_00180 [Muribaculaceae bacterium Isolate-039 (Harlan)]|nr:hypothetical protein EEL34_00180 [Muribaculaceae bacterium Isolate-039 (Harlan)]
MRLKPVLTVLLQIPLTAKRFHLFPDNKNPIRKSPRKRGLNHIFRILSDGIQNLVFQTAVIQRRRAVPSLSAIALPPEAQPAELPR